MKSKRPIVYRACKMTGRYQDELRMESEQIIRMLNNYGFKVLDPVEIEQVPYVHELLEQTDDSKLERYWKRDKECLQECHIILDDRSCNKSDGVGVELGISRFAYWKPVIRIFPKAGICISKLEYDMVFETREEAVMYMAEHFGNKRQILLWRLKMLNRSLLGFIGLQIKFIKDLL